ncbi:MAG: addiction module protein [Gammaproteobacteria bacterium]
MAQPLPNPPPGFDALTTDEQLEYVQSLWQRIVSNPAAIPVPDWHLNVIEKRLADYRDAPNDGKSWDEIREEVIRRLDNT